MNYEQEIEILKRQIFSLRRQIQFHEEWLDTICSPLHKRIWWFIKGYNFYTVGKWKINANSK